MAEHYLLELVETGASGNEFVTRHLIEAEDRQKVKYHYHRTLKDWGWHDTQYGKHTLSGPNGLHSDIMSIEKIDSEDAEVLGQYIRDWDVV